MNIKNREETKEDISYVQHYEAFRDLNGHMWKIPMIAMTITGGLLYGLENTSQPSYLHASLLILAAIVNLGLIVVLLRTRFIMQRILDKMKEYGKDYYIDGKGEKFYEQPHTVVFVFSILLGFTALLCIIFGLDLFFS